MAMTTCPNCGEQISDKAKKCVHCGAILIPEEKKYCPDCGAEVEEGMDTCPKCGCPIENTIETEKTPQQVEVTGVKITKKSKKIIVIAAIAVIVAAIIAAVGVVFDLCTNCMLFTLMCARINCIIAGCCKGTFVFHTCYRWPTRELEIVFYVVLILVFSYKLKISETNGIIYPIYMISYGIFRFIVEFFRVGDGNLLIHPAHIWALISLCIGLSVYAEIKNKEKKGRRSKND